MVSSENQQNVDTCLHFAIILSMKKQRRSLGSVTISSDVWKMVNELMLLYNVTKPLDIVAFCVRNEYRQQKKG
jgi:hypothetical protein